MTVHSCTYALSEDAVLGCFEGRIWRCISVHELAIWHVSGSVFRGVRGLIKNETVWVIWGSVSRPEVKIRLFQVVPAFCSLWRVGRGGGQFGDWSRFRGGSVSSGSQSGLSWKPLKIKRSHKTNTIGEIRDEIIRMYDSTRCCVSVLYSFWEKGETSETCETAPGFAPVHSRQVPAPKQPRK